MGLEYGFIMIMWKKISNRKKNLNDKDNLDCEWLFVPIQLPLSSLTNLKHTKPEKDNFARNDGQIYVV